MKVVIMSTRNDASWPLCARKPKRPWIGMTGLVCGTLLLSLSACRSAPSPCECGEAFKETERYTQEYLFVLEDNGILRQRLKACEERR